MNIGKENEFVEFKKTTSELKERILTQFTATFAVTRNYSMPVKNKLLSEL